jgi:hypothetical protein
MCLLFSPLPNATGVPAGALRNRVVTKENTLGSYGDDDERVAAEVSRDLAERAGARSHFGSGQKEPEMQSLV